MLSGVSDKDILTIENILNLHLGKYEIWAFGSRVKGEPKKYSDLDLAVITNSPLPEKTLSTVKNVFDESNLPFKVDVLDWASLSENFKILIKNDYVVLKKRR